MYDDGTSEMMGGYDHAGYAMDPAAHNPYGNGYSPYHVPNQRLLQQHHQHHQHQSGNHFSQPQQQQRKFKRNFKITGTPVCLNVQNEIPQSSGKEIMKDSIENNIAPARQDSRWIRCGDKLKKVPINAIAEVEASSTDEKEKTFSGLSSSTTHQDVASRMLTDLYHDDDKTNSTTGSEHHDSFATVVSSLQYPSNGNDYGTGNYGTRTGTIFDSAVSTTFDTNMYTSPFNLPNSQNIQQQQNLQQQQQQQQQQLHQQQQQLQQQQQYGITDNNINLLDNFLSQPQQQQQLQQQQQQLQQQQQQLQQQQQQQYGIADNNINLLDNLLSQPQQQQRLSPTRQGFFNDGGVGFSSYNDDNPLKQSYLGPQHSGVLSQLGAWPSAMPPSPTNMSSLCPPLMFVPQDDGGGQSLLTSSVQDNLLLGCGILPEQQMFQDPPSVHLGDSLPPLPVALSPTRNLGPVDLPALVLADDRGYCDALLSSSSALTTTSEEILGETLHEDSIYDSILADDETSPAPPASVIPEEYLCPLTKQVMVDPVICADGATYEKAVIEKWIANLEKMNAKLISPVTGEEFSHTLLVPNFSIKLLISSYHETSCR